MSSFALLSRKNRRINSLFKSLLPLWAHDNKSHSVPFTRQYSSHNDDKVLTISSINQNLVELRYDVRGIVAKRADQISEELKVCR